VSGRFLLCTVQTIITGQVIVEFLGDRLSKDERLARNENSSRYAVALRSGGCIEAEKRGSLARFVNHHCARANV
jgi:hypothetical protein